MTDVFDLSGFAGSRSHHGGLNQHNHHIPQAIGSFNHANNSSISQFLSSANSSSAGGNHQSNSLLLQSHGATSIDMECESPRLNTGGGGGGGLSYHTRSMGPVAMSLANHSSSHLLNISSGLSSGSSGRNPPPHIIPSSLLDSGASSSLTGRYGGGGSSSSGGPSSLPVNIDFSNSSVTNFPGYLNMNLNNGPPPPTSSLECTQTGSLNMPLMGGIITSGGSSAFNMNLNLTGLPPHHLGSSLNSTTGLVSSISSQNMQQSSSSGGYPPPPSQFLGNILPSFSSVSNTSTVGYTGSSSNSVPRGGSESGSSASSADLGISNSGSGGKSNNLLLSLSSRGGRQGTVNSSEEDRDRDDSPMVCQQSPVASH